MMQKFKSLSVAVAACLLVACSGSSTDDDNSTTSGNPSPATVVNVAYFGEWATPNLIAKAVGKYDEILGVSTNWVEFQAGTEMTAAMLAGNIDIAYSQGMAPFVTGVNAGAPIQTIAVATLYPANPCIVRNGSGINSTNAQDLEGKSVAVPLGTMAEHSFRQHMITLGVDQSLITIIDQTPTTAADSLLNGSVDMACLYSSQSIDNALLGGTPLLSNDQMEANGIINFDVVSASNEFADANPQLIIKFLQVTDNYNKSFQNTQPELDLIVNESGLDEQAVRAQMSDLKFPTAAVQLATYLNNDGQVNQAFQVAGEVFGTTENPALLDYSLVINSAFLR